MFKEVIYGITICTKMVSHTLYLSLHNRYIFGQEGALILLINDPAFVTSVLFSVLPFQFF